MADVKSFDMKDIDNWYQMVRAGDELLLSGTIYTARDAAHKRILKAIHAGEALPFPLGGTAIYYAGPTPAKHGLPIGSCGPTTSSRMDPYVPILSSLGLRATIGKGDRSDAVYEALKTYGGIYLCALGGAGALGAKSVVSCEVIAYNDLGCESIKRLQIKDFPLFVGIDFLGNSIFR